MHEICTLSLDRHFPIVINGVVYGSRYQIYFHRYGCIMFGVLVFLLNSPDEYLTFLCMMNKLVY